MNNCPVWAGCGYGCGRQAASTYKQYVCFAFLRNLVLAAPKPAIYSFASPYWWLVAYPGLALGLTLLALNFLGDGLRDALDPRMKNR